MSAMKIEEVLKKYADNLMSLSGVVGVGQGLCDGKPCIKVFLIKKTRKLEEKFPEKLRVTKYDLRRRARCEHIQKVKFQFAVKPNISQVQIN